LRDGTKAAKVRASQIETQTDLGQERNDGIKKEIELLKIIATNCNIRISNSNFGLLFLVVKSGYAEAI
jgi:hypothetical protein